MDVGFFVFMINTSAICSPVFYSLYNFLVISKDFAEILVFYCCIDRWHAI